MRCIENAILHSKIEITDSLKYLMKKMWEFVDTQTLDKWDDEVFRTMEPEFVLDTIEDIGDPLLKLQHQNVSKIYKTIPYFIVEMISYVFGIGSEHLYTGMSNNSPETLKYILKVLEIMKKNGIPTPEEDLYLKLVNKEWDGWGNRIDSSFFGSKIC